MTDQLAQQAAQQPWVTILISWVGSGFLSALVAGAYNLWAKRNEYVNEYYKTVIKRRIAAYEELEKLILQLKTAVVGEDDNRPYHFMFSSEKDEDWQRGWMLLYEVMSHGLWLSEEVYSKTRELNFLMFHFGKPQSVIEFGKKNYQAIATLRNDLETLLARDMLSLHDVKRFPKSKDKPDPGFHPIMLKK